MGQQAQASANREAVKTLAISMGVRAAAREMGIPEATVQAWSARYKWFADPPKPPTITNPNGATIATKSPSTALIETLQKRSDKTKLNLSRYTEAASRKAAKSKGNLELAKSVKEVAGTAALIHGWQNEQKQAGDLNLQVLSGQTVIQIGQKPSE